MLILGKEGAVIVATFGEVSVLSFQSRLRQDAQIIRQMTHRTTNKLIDNLGVATSVTNIIPILRVAQITMFLLFVFVVAAIAAKPVVKVLNGSCCDLHLP